MNTPDIKIVKLSYNFSNAQYEAALGVSRAELIAQTVVAYSSLWEAKYADNENIDQMRKAEGMDDPNKIIKTLISFAKSSISPHDSLQSGDEKSMYIAVKVNESGKIDNEDAVEGLIQFSDFNFSNFEKKRLDPLMSVYHKVNAHAGLNPSAVNLATTLSHVGKPQREYHSAPAIGDALMKAALTKTFKTSAFIVSYDAAETALGYEDVVKTTTMDSRTPCHFMVGKTENIIAKLDERIANDSDGFEFETIEI